MIEFIQAYQAAARAMENMIVNAFMQAYLSAVALVIHGSPNSRISAAVILLGLTYIFRRGLWKMTLKVLGLWAWAKI